MTWTTVIAWTARTTSVVLAALLARRRTEHRPIAVFLAVALVADAARWGIAAACPWIWHPGPWAGWQRAVFHADELLFATWPVGLWTVAWLALLRRRPALPLAAGAVVALALVAGYPTPFRGTGLAWAYASVHAAALLATAVAFGVWMRRREPPRPEHASIALIALLDIALFAGPYAPPHPNPFAWSYAQSTYLVTYVALVVLHVAALAGGFLQPTTDR